MRLPLLVTKGAITLGTDTDKVVVQRENPEYAAIVAALKNPQGFGNSHALPLPSAAPCNAPTAPLDIGFTVVVHAASGRQEVLARNVVSGRCAKRIAVQLNADDCLDSIGEPLRKVEVRDARHPARPCFVMEWR